MFDAAVQEPPGPPSEDGDAAATASVEPATTAAVVPARTA